MSAYGGPQIVSDGLTMMLDVNNPRSYPGTGTVWTDLVQGLPFSALGVTTTPTELIGQNLTFAFNNSGYWQSTGNPDLVDLGGDCTVIIMFYPKTITARRTIFEKAGTIYASYEQELAVTLETGYEYTYYSRRFALYDSGGTNSNVLNRWNMMAIRISTGRTAVARTGSYSFNGAPFITAYTSRSDTALVTAGALRVGTGYAGIVEAGNIGFLCCYNKLLSNIEIKQNFDALRVRFGI